MSRNIDKIIIHSSRTTVDMIDALNPISKPIDKDTLGVWAIDAGKPNIPYHFVITADGRTQTGLNVDKVGGHSINDNSNSIGICMIGGIADTRYPSAFSDAEYTSLKKLLKALKSSYNILTIYSSDKNITEWLDTNKLALNEASE